MIEYNSKSTIDVLKKEIWKITDSSAFLAHIDYGKYFQSTSILSCNRNTWLKLAIFFKL